MPRPFVSLSIHHPTTLKLFKVKLITSFYTTIGLLGVNSERLRAAIDESRQHLFAAAGYAPDIFAETFLPLE
ncbi:hypothetical protein PYR77_05485 [Acinetobacter soli]|uniref:hypothetical protein n=1 Tax=Acinetobacter soli TaxID=487316 RepID=UPI002090283E|nr:hypothetical protein [Acinetobacter soli]WEH92782.1 hypothetical protein PYR75_05895 [Acinetobacter soli]WEH98032.1 hypothetical protein PYR76_02525 [Acinetobacter soli]WEI01390.1 hypothetical protein PYR77_05485 [Acinetobacter soli]